jgi:hypothetical protein
MLFMRLRRFLVCTFPLFRALPLSSCGSLWDWPAHKAKIQKKLKTLQNGVFGLGVQWDLAGSRRNCVLAAAALPG